MAATLAEQNWIASAGATTSPEAATAYIDFPYCLTQALWTNPLTNRILLEAGYSRLSYDHAGGPGQLPPDGIFDIGVTEQSAAAKPASGLHLARSARQLRLSRAVAVRGQLEQPEPLARVRVVRDRLAQHEGRISGVVPGQQHEPGAERQLAVVSFNQGVPNKFTMTIPEWRTADRTSVAAIFVQDTWTRGRLTLQGALRYDRAWSSSPGGAEFNGTPVTSRINPAPIAFETTKSVDAFNDITPRLGVAYDVFGNGRTAVKFNMGHYLDAATNDSAYTRNNPANRIVSR